MVVLDRLRKLDKDSGTTDHVDHWKKLKGTDKVAFALQLKVDRDASFMSVTESHAQTNTMNKKHHAEMVALLRLKLLHKKTFTSGHIVIQSSRSWLTYWRGCQSGPMRLHCWPPRATSSMHTLPRPWPRLPGSGLARLSPWLRAR